MLILASPFPTFSPSTTLGFVAYSLQDRRIRYLVSGTTLICTSINAFVSERNNQAPVTGNVAYRQVLD
jgi:hypothetical protein